MRSFPARIAIRTLVRWATVLAFAIALAFPFYWMIITSFKSTGDLYNVENNPFRFNMRPTLEHIRFLFRETLFPT